MHPDDPLSQHFRISESTAKALKKLGIASVRDLLYHFPAHYEDAAEAQYVRDATAGETVVIHGMVSDLSMKKSPRKRREKTEGLLANACREKSGM